MGIKNTLTKSDYLTYKEYERLLHCLRAHKHYVWEMYARVSFCTACRASDVLNLRWVDILDKSECVITEKKTKKVRRVYFNQSVQKRFRELYELMEQPNKNSFIFVPPTKNNEDGPAMTIQWVNKTLKEFKRIYRIKVGNFSTHTFRKTFGRYVYEKHGRSAESLILLNSIFSHGSIDTTKTYIGIRQDEINKIFDTIKF